MQMNGRTISGIFAWRIPWIEEADRLQCTGWLSRQAWEDYSNYFWEGVEIPRIWATTHSLVFYQCLGNVKAPLGVSFHLLTEDQGLVLSAVLVPFDSNWFMLCPWAMSFFQKLCLASLPPVTFPLLPFVACIHPILVSSRSRPWVNPGSLRDTEIDSVQTSHCRIENSITAHPAIK